MKQNRSKNQQYVNEESEVHRSHNSHNVMNYLLNAIEKA